MESNEGGKWRSGNVMRFEVESNGVLKWRVTRFRNWRVIRMCLPVCNAQLCLQLLLHFYCV